MLCDDRSVTMVPNAPDAAVQRPETSPVGTTSADLERYRGVLLGTAIGDALGLAAEGMSARAIARRFGAVERFHLLGRRGFVSDDTEQSALVAQSLAVDLASADAPKQVIGKALEAFGQLDILYNNAGVASNALAAQMTDEAWDATQDVNLKAVFRMCREAIPHLVASPAGRIVSTASVMANGTDYGLAAYCASKAGVVGLMRTLALELGKHGVTANAVLPGAIRTGMTARSFADPGIADVWAKKSVLRRLGEPIDVARVALFLVSEDGGFVTGQAIAADGGMTLRI